MNNILLGVILAGWSLTLGIGAWSESLGFLFTVYPFVIIGGYCLFQQMKVLIKSSKVSIHTKSSHS